MVEKKEAFVIALSGPAGVGKTTTAIDLEGALTRMGYKTTLINEGVQEVLKDFGYKTVDDLRRSGSIHEFQEELMARHIESILNEKCYSSDYIIVDRTIWDIWLYTVFYGSMDDISSFWAVHGDEFDSSCGSYKRLYDRVFLFPPLSRVVGNDLGIRSEEDITYANAHYRMLLSWIPREIKVVMLPMSRSDRVDYILFKLGIKYRED